MKIDLDIRDFILSIIIFRIIMNKAELEKRKIRSKNQELQNLVIHLLRNARYLYEADKIMQMCQDSGISLTNDQKFKTFQINPDQAVQKLLINYA